MKKKEKIIGFLKNKFVVKKGTAFECIDKETWKFNEANFMAKVRYKGTDAIFIVDRKALDGIRASQDTF